MSEDAREAGASALMGFVDIMESNRAVVDHDELARRFPALAEVEVTAVDIEGPHGVVPARSYRPVDPAIASFVWVHGGGFVAGDLDMYESHWVALELAAQGIAVVALDYTKARDGVHHPVPSDDVLAGWAAAVSDADLLGGTAGPVHLGGASAGATLAVSVALRARAGAAPAPGSLVLIYPALHAKLPVPSADAAAAAATAPPEMRFTPEFMDAINLNYVGSSDALADPLAFPGHSDLAGLPRTLVLNAEADDLRASGEAFAHELTAAGVPVELGYEPGTRHGYLDQPGSPEAIRTIDRIAQWLVRTI